MPFRNSNLSTLPPDPTVRIFLQGQLILEPETDGSKCDVGVSRCSPDHQFSIEVRERMKRSEEPDIILMRNRGILEPSGIEIQPGSINGVTRFAPGTFSRDDPFSDPNDLRWIVDLSTAEFHDNEVEFDGISTEPNIRIFEGLFYTALTTDENLIHVTRTKGGLGDWPMHRIAALIGVNIYSDEVVLSFTNNGQGEKLRLKRQADRYYEIRINNDPSFVNPNPSKADVANHKELREYYRAVNGLVKPDPANPGSVIVDPDFKHFELQFELQDAIPGLGSPTIPCMPSGNGT